MSVSDCSEDTETPPVLTAVGFSHGSARTTNNTAAIRQQQKQTRRRRAGRLSVGIGPAAASGETDEADTNDPQTGLATRYRQSVDLIVQRCTALSADNERLVHRLHYVKQLTRRKERDVALLKRRLDDHSDGWRTAQPEPQFDVGQPTLIPATNNVIVRKKYKKREKSQLPPPVDQQAVEYQHEQQHLVQNDAMHVKPVEPPQPEHQQLEQQHHHHQFATTIIDSDEHVICTSLKEQPDDEPIAHVITRTAPIVRPAAAPAAVKPMGKPPAAKKPSKRNVQRTERTEKDPQAPKRPANPFFQFCQEQRSILMGELNSVLLPGQPELSKQELTRQLASRWRSLDAGGKQIYIEMYECSKRKYNEEMQCYRDGGGGGVVRRLKKGKD